STESTSSETLFGINPESVALVSVAVIASAMLALGVWVLRRRWPLVLAVIFGLAFAALDIREAIHQIHESRTSLVMLAFVLTALHLVISAVAGLVLQRSKPAAVAA